MLKLQLNFNDYSSVSDNTQNLNKIYSETFSYTESDTKILDIESDTKTENTLLQLQNVLRKHGIWILY